MSPGRRRVGAIIRKELREFRRTRSLLLGMAIVPLVFCIQPLVSVFALGASASPALRDEHVLLYMLGIPALVPAFIAAYSVVGERQQGTLEPILTTPISREELLLGKALAALLPSTAVAYLVYAIFLACVRFFADAAVSAALIRPPDLLAQLFLTPFIAGWSIWLAMLISTRANDVRVAQQLATLASLPSVAVTTLSALDIIPVTPVTALVAAGSLLALNGFGLWAVARAFDRERLIAGVQ